MDVLNKRSHKTENNVCEDMASFAEKYEEEYKEDTLVKIIIVGAGNRGKVYATYALEHPSRAKVVAVADPIQFRREQMAKSHEIPSDRVFSDWQDCAALEKFADAVVIATPDAQHAVPAITFMNKGYHILVEKPMAVSKEDCVKMTEAALRNNVIMAVGHVMRYTPFTQKVKKLIEEGAIGDVISVQHLEPVGYWHAAHSYVRGNWRREDESTFMLMAKSCHDVDWLRYVVGKPFKKVSSFGSRRHFTKEAKPKEAGDATRCLDCKIQDTCPYSAKTIYLKPAERGHRDWPLPTVVPNAEPDVQNVTEALKTGPYGRCVYECDNDVVDNQVVNMEFEDGTTASFSMVSFTKDLCVRKTRIFGSKGQLECEGSDPPRIEWDDFTGEGSTQLVHPEPTPPTLMRGHQCADYYLMRAFVHAVARKDPSFIVSGPIDTLESYIVVFKAEEARKDGKVLDVNVQQECAIKTVW
jgi:predicted dehydrogenase